MIERIERRSEFIERAAVVNEALTWMGTKFHMGGRIKRKGEDEGGVDCGEFLIAVYSALGIMPDFQPEYYSPQWHLHDTSQTREEHYMRDVKRFAKEIDGPPECGDLAMFHIGRVYAHAAIVIDWPTRIIHAPAADIPGGVQIGDASRDALLLRGGRQFPPKFFSPWR